MALSVGRAMLRTTSLKVRATERYVIYRGTGWNGRDDSELERQLATNPTISPSALYLVRLKH
jgi:hypothetical protein